MSDEELKEKIECIIGDGIMMSLSESFEIEKVSEKIMVEVLKWHFEHNTGH